MFRSQSRFSTVSKKRPLFNLSVRLHTFFVKKTARKRIGKEEKLTFFKTPESRLRSWIQFSNVKSNHQFSPFSYAFTCSFLLRTRVNAQKDWKADVLRSQSRTAIVSETRSVLFRFQVLFCAFKCVFENSCLLGWGPMSTQYITPWYLHLQPLFDSDVWRSTERQILKKSDIDYVEMSIWNIKYSLVYEDW